MGTPNTPGSMSPPPRATVLCIDDDPLVLHFFRDFLPAHGFRTLTLTDGLPGIELARQTRPDVILLDIMLRGLSGYDICRKLRADPALRDIPIILLTVLDDPGVATTGRAAGATSFSGSPPTPTPSCGPSNGCSAGSGTRQRRDRARGVWHREGDPRCERHRTRAGWQSTPPTPPSRLSRRAAR